MSSENGYLTRAELLAAIKSPQLKTADVDVPEWGGVVQVTQMTAAQKHKVSAMMVGRDGELDMSQADGMFVRVAAYGLGLGEKQLDVLGKNDPDVVERVANVVMGMSGMETGAVVEAKKN